MTQHLPQPLELVTVQKPVDMQATPCLQENCLFGPHTYEEERVPQPRACFPLLRTNSGTLLVIRFGRFGGTPYCGDPVGMNYVCYDGIKYQERRKTSWTP